MFVLDLRIRSNFPVNSFPPKPLEVATSNFAEALVRSKVGIFDGVPLPEVWLLGYLWYLLYMCCWWESNLSLLP